MKITEKESSYHTTNSYSTLNTLTERTKNVWLVCHGIGYLSKYFLKYFDLLDSQENYIIAPQAPSKYYLGTNYKHVGASWLTKENTENEMANNMRYLDKVIENERLPSEINLIALGYSQGVSVISRYVANRKLNCSHLLLLSGGLPKELKSNDFEFLREKTKVSLVYGTKDEYLNELRMEYEKKRYFELFGDQAAVISFNGKHEVNKLVIKDLISAY